MLDLFQDKRVELESIFAAHKVKRAEIFGSATTDAFSERSDIDLLITFKEDIALLDYADNYFLLKEKLEKLLDRNIDLVSAKSLRNPVLIESINKSKVSLYAA